MDRRVPAYILAADEPPFLIFLLFSEPQVERASVGLNAKNEELVKADRL